MTARSLAGRRVLLTGGSRGIGRAIARELLAKGARLALLGRDADALRATLDGATGEVIVADLAVLRDASGLVTSARDGLGGLDALVSCAGMVRYEPLLDVEPSSLADQLQLNFIAPFALAVAAGRAMAEQGGDLVFVASTLGLRPAPLTAAYAASKAALISLCRSCALELGPHGIRANAVLPGVIDTDMINVLRPDANAPIDADPAQRLAAQRRALADLHLLRRLGTPQEVAEAVRYLLQSDFVTGSLLTVDGGLSVGA